MSFQYSSPTDILDPLSSLSDAVHEVHERLHRSADFRPLLKADPSSESWRSAYSLFARKSVECESSLLQWRSELESDIGCSWPFSIESFLTDLKALNFCGTGHQPASRRVSLNDRGEALGAAWCLLGSAGGASAICARHDLTATSAGHIPCSGLVAKATLGRRVRQDLNSKLSAAIAERNAMPNAIHGARAVMEHFAA